MCIAVPLSGTIGCRKPVACSQIVDAPLLSVAFDTLDRSTIVDWIKTNYASGDLWNVKEGPGYNWQYSGKEYSALIESDIQVIHVRLSPQPTIGEVVRCFGKPDAYFMREIGVERLGVDLTIWYLGKGWMFGYYGSGTLGATRLASQSPLVVRQLQTCKIAESG
jgi:hypothetical protein